MSMRWAPCGEMCRPASGEPGDWQARRAAPVAAAPLLRLEKAPQVEQIEEAAFDLEPTGQPCAGETARILRDRYDNLAPGGKANLGGRRCAVGHLDRIGAMRAESGQIGDAEI